MNAYVAGFMFDLSTGEVALIRKSKPAWQAGKLNAIGGKIELGETAVAAMVREFHEEAGHLTMEESWRHYAELTGPGWHVQFFATTGDVLSLESPEKEKVEVHAITNVLNGSLAVIGNISWLLPMAIDALNGSGPSFVTAHYSAS